MSESSVQHGEPSHLYQVGVWLLDKNTNILKHQAVTRELEHRLVMLLLYFIQHAGEILHRDLLLKTIWQGKVVNEDSLAVAVSQLRKALDDNPRAPSYIKTIPGLGYQFIATAHPLSAAAATPGRHRPPATMAPRMIIAGVIAGVLAIAAYFLRDYPAADASQLAAVSLAKAQTTPEIIAEKNRLAEALLAGEGAEQWRESIKVWRSLLAVESDYAPAYVGIAEAKVKLLGDRLAEANNCAEVTGLLQGALGLEPQLPAAHLSLANTLFWCRGDYPAAEARFLTAMDLAPQNPAVPMYYAQFLLALGRFEESRHYVERARELNPLTYSIPSLVWIYQMQGRDDLALKELQRIAVTEPDNRWNHISAQRVYARLGDEQAAFDHWLWLLRDAGYANADLNDVSAVFAQGGLAEVNRWLLQRNAVEDLGQYTPPLSWGRYAIAAGDYDLALDHLEAAFLQHQLPLLWAAVDPIYDPLRQQPRFQAMLASLPRSEK